MGHVSESPVQKYWLQGKKKKKGYGLIKISCKSKVKE